MDLLIKELRTTLEKQEIALHVSSEIKDFILDKGYSMEFGVRALRRVLETELIDKIADHLLKNTDRPLDLKPKIAENNVIISSTLFASEFFKVDFISDDVFGKKVYAILIIPN